MRMRTLLVQRICWVALFILASSIPEIGNTNETSSRVKKNTNTESITQKANRPVRDALSANNYIRTKRMLQAAIAKPVPKAEQERKSWYRALFALITLERLIGSRSQAKILFARCGSGKNETIGCREIATGKEWAAMQRWACKEEPLPEPCVK